MGPVTTTAPPLARCVIRACPFRFTTGGPDRLCAEHGRDGGGATNVADRIAQLMNAPGQDNDTAQTNLPTPDRKILTCENAPTRATQRQGA
jgi:hypothetical protein